jgi:hypothetical protein
MMKVAEQAHDSRDVTVIDRRLDAWIVVRRDRRAKCLAEATPYRPAPR